MPHHFPSNLRGRLCLVNPFLAASQIEEAQPHGLRLGNTRIVDLFEELAADLASRIDGCGYIHIQTATFRSSIEAAVRPLLLCQTPATTHTPDTSTVKGRVWPTPPFVPADAIWR